MRLGVNTWVWTSPLNNDELGRLAVKVSEMGFQHIEIPIELSNDVDYARAGDIAGERGLTVSACAAMGPEQDLISPDADIRAGGMKYVRYCIESAQALGATNLIGPMYSAVGRTWQQPADERERDMELLTGELRELATYAGEHGVVLCIEPLNRFETSFINLASQAVELIDRVGHPSCAIMLDTFHMNIEERSLGDAIRAAGTRLKHVHACENDRGAPGSGHVPWDDVATALLEIGYDGPVVIESFTAKVKSIARAAAIWRALAVSQDELAEEGLRHLRKIFAAA
ncbi:MAG: sugar phosphate isomerase/epimerase [Gemmatimonadetes bacterium]|nr:sugar phosphate isomerase/epimerase [Gemmatimonadota bacterium]